MPLENMVDMLTKDGQYAVAQLNINNGMDQAV